MAIPAERDDSNKIVALVTKFGLIGMAVHACILKTLVISFPAAALIDPVGLADSLISPLIQYLHVLSPHECLRLYALSGLFRPGRELRFRGF